MPNYTTPGKLLVDEALPEALRGSYGRLDKQGLAALLTRLAREHSDQYADTVEKLLRVGRDVAYTSGGESFGLAHLTTPPGIKAARDKLQRKVDAILDDEQLAPAAREKQLIDLMAEASKTQDQVVLQETLAAHNPLAHQVVSGSRGNAANLSTLLASDLLYVDHRNRPQPLPILRSYSQGLTPSQYFAGAYGARKGCLAVGTPVRMANLDIKLVEDIVAGDMVLGCDLQGRTFPVRVVAVFDNGPRPCVRTAFCDFHSRVHLELRSTTDHKLLARCVDSMGYCGYGKFPVAVVGYSSVFAYNASPCSPGFSLERIGEEQCGTYPTRDLEVDHPDHLFVLANGLVVENSVDVKLGVAETGALSKLMKQATHRLLVTDVDAATPNSTLRGLPTTVDEPDNEGALLAAPAGGYPRNTVLTPRLLQHLKQQGVQHLLVRSPMVGGPADGGVYARDVGVREYGTLPSRGTMSGIIAADALSEPLAQGTLGSKHSGGTLAASSKGALGSFKQVEQLLQIPKTFQHGATHAELDGRVSAVTPAPAGGHHILVGEQSHYVPTELAPLVQPGDQVEAGDALSEGTPNPEKIVEHKGLGAGRKYLAEQLSRTLQDSGLKGHRRNTELLARGLINHVQLTDVVGDYSPDEVVPYHALEAGYQPRPGFETVAPHNALGKHLELPYLHYAIGDKVRPSVVKHLEQFGVQHVAVHRDPPLWKPLMVRAADTVRHDPDWLVRQYGGHITAGLLESVHRGATSDRAGTSFVPGLAERVHFGTEGKVVKPKELA